MTATYSGDPSSSDQDEVRFLLGDTDTSNARLSDNEISFLLVEWENPYLAAAAGADQLAATAAQWISYTTDGTTLTVSDAQEKYARLADQLRDRFNKRYRAVWWTATASRGDWETYAQDDSVKHGEFSEGMHDNRYISGLGGGATPEELKGEGPW